MSEETNPALDAEKLAALRGQAKAMTDADLYSQLDLAKEILKNQNYKSHEEAVMRHQALQAEVKSREDDYLGWAQGKYQWEGDF